MTEFNLGLHTTFKGEYKDHNDKVVLISRNRNEILYIAGMLSNLNAAIDVLGYDNYVSYKMTQDSVTYRITISWEHIYQMYLIGDSFTIVPRLSR